MKTKNASSEKTKNTEISGLTVDSTVADRNMEIIRILASEYTSVYYIDLTTDELIPYTMNKETESQFGHLFKNMSYSDAYRLYVDSMIYDADKTMMLHAGSISNIRKQLRSQKTFITTFRSNDNNGTRFSEMKFVKVGDDNSEPKAVALGFADRDREIAIRYVDKKLISEYISVMLVDMETDTYRMISHTDASYMPDVQKGCYSESVINYAGLVADEYRELWSKISNLDFMRQYLADGDRREYSYVIKGINGKNEWRRCVAQVVERKNGVPTMFIMTYLAIDEASSEALELDIKHKRDMDIINILASEYSSVYYIDLDTDALSTYTMNEETESEFGSIFRSGIAYSDAFRMYVDSLVYKEDKVLMLKAGSVANIRKNLSDKKSFITNFRSDNNGSPRYCEMKFVKVGDSEDEPKAVALGFADKDSTIRAELERASEESRNNEIIKILASEYTSVYYIDLETDDLTPYTMNEETENQFGVLFKNMKYSDAFRMYVNRLIVPEDRNRMLRAGSIGNIIKELHSKKTFITTYRSENNGNPHYCEMKFVKVGDDEGIPKAVALGFADKDEELRKRVETETERQRNTDIIEILASEYSSVYYIDLTTDELDPYTMNEETETEFGQVFRSGIKYTEAYRMYVNTLVYEADRMMMLRAGSLYNILSELQNKKTFITTFRSDNNGDPHYCEMKFVKVGDDDNPQAVALGFTDKNEEIRKELARKAENDRNFEIIRILASEYSSVYFIDMQSDSLEPYTMNEDTESRFGQIFRGGIKYSDAYRMYVDRLIYEDDREMMLKAGSLENIEEELSDKKTFITTYRSIQNGQVRYCEMKFVKVGADDAKPVAVALGFADKDEEIRLEQEHRRQADFITGLSDDYDAVFFVNLDQNYIREVRKSEDYLNLNKSLSDGESYLEYLNEIDKNPHFADGSELKDILLPENVIQELNHSHAVFKNYSMVNGEETVYYQVKLVRSPSWFENHEFIFGVHNMDELVKTQIAQENALAEARNRAEAASRSKSMFLSNMSHDIRTPMNAIIGFTEMARKHIGDSEKVDDCLDKVLSSGHHLLNLINDVLDMSRIESGKVVISEVPMNIRKAGKDAMTIAYASAASRGLTLLVHSDDGIADLNIYGDKVRLSEIVLNIISNSVKYTEPGGHIDVRLKKVPCEDPERLFCDFIVEDSGIGMSPEFVERIFEPFERSSSSTVSGIQGTGLGMAITKQLIEMMGGSIEVSSKVGVGTKVTVHFNFRLAGEELPEEETAFDENAEVLAGRRVLLVEDNEMNREIAAELLGDFQLSVEEACDGTEAVDIIRKYHESGDIPFDIVLMDIQMPKMDGYQATKEIRQILMNEKTHLPIYALTANAFDEDRRQAAEAGMDGHLTKPIIVKELIHVLCTVIAQKAE